MVLIAVSASAPASSQAQAHALQVAGLGRHLHPDRAASSTARTAAVTRAAASGIAAELEAAFVDVGARDVELDRGDALFADRGAARGATKSSMVVAKMLATTVTPRAAGWGACRCRTPRRRRWRARWR